MKTRVQKNSSTFAVDNVEPVTDRLPTWKTRDGISALLAIVNERKKPTPIKSCSGYNSDCVEKVFFNPLINGIHIAFEQHRPLVLSPDMLWITILQGLSQHIRNHSERFRDKLVRHQGKKTLAIFRPDIIDSSPENDWESVFADFNILIRENVSPLYDDLVSDFSTTGFIERAVCDVTLMDMYAPFFVYLLLAGCGIPSITLEGKTSDWSKLRKKIEHLSDFDLDWWLDDLRVIADQFVNASRGKVDSEFWQNMYKARNGYGDIRINGWIARLIPYIKCGLTDTFTRINPLLGTSFIVPAEFGNDYSLVEISSDMLPSGIATVNVILINVLEKTRKDIQFLGGFVGVEQMEESMALRPKLGWAVVDAEKDPMFGDMPDNCIMRPSIPTADYAENIKRLSPENWRIRIPDDFSKFYLDCDGLTFSDNSNSARFRSLIDVEIVEKPTILYGRKVLGYVPEVDSYLRKDREQYPWYRFCDFHNGTYFALEAGGFYINEGDLCSLLTAEETGEYDAARIQVLEGQPCIWRVCLVDPSTGTAEIVATKFSDFVRMFSKSLGTLDSFFLD